MTMGCQLGGVLRVDRRGRRRAFDSRRRFRTTGPALQRDRVSSQVYLSSSSLRGVLEWCGLGCGREGRSGSSHWQGRTDVCSVAHTHTHTHIRRLHSPVMVSGCRPGPNRLQTENAGEKIRYLRAKLPRANQTFSGGEFRRPARRAMRRTSQRGI